VGLFAVSEVVRVVQECNICGVERLTYDLVEASGCCVCPECHGTLFVDGSIDTTETRSTDDRSPALEVFSGAVEFLHGQVDRPTGDYQSGEHAERPGTGRRYFERVRGWDAETVDAKWLGWGPGR
jgi:hypothetical protein